MGHLLSMGIKMQRAVATCNAPTLTSITDNGSTISINWTLGGGTCSAVTVQSSTDNFSWGSDTGSCTSPRTYTKPTVTTYYRVIMNCPSGNSVPSNVLVFTIPAPIIIVNFYDEAGGYTFLYKNGSLFANVDANTGDNIYNDYVAGDIVSVETGNGQVNEIQYYLNGTLINTYSNYFYGTVSTANITVGNGNTYRFNTYSVIS
jgi:hypothetical protein